MLCSSWLLYGYMHHSAFADFPLCSSLSSSFFSQSFIMFCHLLCVLLSFCKLVYFIHSTLQGVGADGKVSHRTWAWMAWTSAFSLSLSRSLSSSSFSDKKTALICLLACCSLTICELVWIRSTESWSSLTIFYRRCELKNDVLNLTDAWVCLLIPHHASLQDVFWFEIVNNLYGKLCRDCCFMLIVCVAAPTEGPGDDQKGVRRSAWLEASEREESQRTFLNRELTWETPGCC